MGRYERAQSVLFFVRPLRALAATDIERLAARFYVSRRTIYRDISALRRDGFNVPPFSYRPEVKA